MSGYTAGDIAKAMGKVKTTILRRAEKEKWSFENGKNRVMRYKLEKLPADVQKALVEKDRVGIDALPVLAPEAAFTAATKFMEGNPLTLTLPPLGRGNFVSPLEGSLGIMENRGESWTDETALSMDVIRDPKVAKWVPIIQEASQIPPGWKKRAWIQAVAEKYGTTFQTIYRKLKAYEKQGLAGLHHTKSSRGQPRNWSPEAIEWWIGLVLKKEHRKIAKDVLYAILADEATRRKWEIGSYESALWWLKKKQIPQFLALQRGGVRALDNTLPPVLRDYSDLGPFEILVGDQHKFDFWVTDEETGEVFRPEGYFWQDLRTRCFYGGALDKKYDSYLMGLALRMGLKIFGPFDQIYTDHGKPEESRYIMGIMKDMRTLGLKAAKTVDAPVDISDADPEEINPAAIMAGTHRKAVVRNAKAKMIESTFNDLEGILRDHFLVPGYVKELGGVQEENEVDQKEIEQLARAGKLLTFWEFVLTVFKAMDYYNGQKHHRGVLREWSWRPKPKKARPMDCLKACYMDGWRPVRMSDEAIDLVFLPREQRTVDRGRIHFRNERYEHEDLIPLEGKVEVRFDPLDQDWILVFRDGEYVARAVPVEYSSMKDMDLAKRKIEAKRRRRKGFILEYRRMTSEIPDFREFSKTPAIEKAAALIGKEARQKNGGQARYRGSELIPMGEEELEAAVARIEGYQAPDRPIFNNEVERYQWCLDQIAEGQALDEKDRDFVNEFELGMDKGTQDYWSIYKDSIGIGGTS